MKFEGLELIDAEEPLILTITPADIKRAKTRGSGQVCYSAKCNTQKRYSRCSHRSNNSQTAI